MEIVIAPADLDAVRQLRDSVLRPRLPPGGSVYPGDNHPETLHLGAFLAGKLVAVASVCCEPPPGECDPVVWRVRGMATLPAQRGHGLGGKLLNQCLLHARKLGGRRVWCSARVGVAEFYHARGFASVGEPFALPQYSDEPYVRMEQQLHVAEERLDVEDN